MILAVLIHFELDGDTVEVSKSLEAPAVVGCVPDIEGLLQGLVSQAQAEAVAAVAAYPGRQAHTRNAAA